MKKQNLKTVIRELAEVYDTDSNDTFISAYLNKNADEKYLQKRVHACETLLSGKEQENFVKTVEEITSFLENNADSNRVIFASHKHDFFKYIPLSLEINNSFVVDSSPYIRPLARIADEWDSFTLVLLNSNHAKIYSVSLGQAEQKKSLSADVMNKHKKGGWSQARFQRKRKGAIYHFYQEITDQLQKIAAERIILAGPGTTKIQFKGTLPKQLREEIINTIDIDMDNEHRLLEESIDVISQQEKEASYTAVEQLKQEFLKDGLAVYGLEETLTAVKNGQVDTLIIEKDYKLKGCICEHCQILRAGPVKECPMCGRPTSEADVIEEILEFAERTDAEIEFTDNEEIVQLGHIGGLLRYKI